MHDPTLPKEILRHGAYVCLAGAAARTFESAFLALADRFHLLNEYLGAPTDSQSPTYAFVRRIDSRNMQIDDPTFAQAEGILHISAPDPQIVDECCRAIPGNRILRGVVRPRVYTSPAIHQLAYEHQVTQRPGEAMPHVFLVPMSKSKEWWNKDWMERHTYFLPRYDAAGHQLAQGHVLAAAPGVPSLYRRTYKFVDLPAPDGDYDFVNYFECADEGIPVFEQVCASLRDVQTNPEWAFVREGPTWQGRRVASWAQMFADIQSPTPSSIIH